MFNKEEEKLMMESRQTLETLRTADKQINATVYDTFKERFDSIDKSKSLYALICKICLKLE